MSDKEVNLQTKRRKYDRFKYSEKQLDDALDAIRSGTLSLNKASALYNVPKATLSTKLNGKTIEGRRMGPTPVLAAHEEQMLEDWILGKAKIGFPMHPDEVKDAVRKFIIDTGRKNPFTNCRPGDKWVKLFLKRHPAISHRNAEIISKGKASLTEGIIRNWFEELEKYLEEENCRELLCDGDRIFNADETGVECCPKTGRVLGPKNYKNFFTIAPGKEKECVTVLANFSASGKIVKPMIVFPYERIPKHITELIPSDTFFVGKSESGWMVAPTFYEYVANCFYPWLLEKQITFPVLLLLDGHKSHLNLELSKFCSEKRILIFSLPPNATNVLQPCDVGVFQPLKASWKNTVRSWKQKHGGSKTITKANFAPLFKEAFESVVDEQKIQNAFKKCGIYPFNVENVDFNKCMQTRHQELTRNSLDKENLCSQKEDRTFLQIMESELPKETLEGFKMALLDESRATDIEEPVLFSIWKKYSSKAALRENAQNNTLDDLVIQPKGPTETNYERSNDLGTLQTTTPVTPDRSCFSDSQTEEIILEQCSLPKNIQSEALILGDLEGIHSSQDQIFKSPTVSSSGEGRRTPEEVWKDHLHWPVILDTKGKKKRNVNTLPYAVTSEKWKEYHEALRKNKEEKEEKLKRKREEKALKQNQKLEASKGKRTSRKAKKDEEDTSTDEDTMSLHDSDESLGDLLQASDDGSSDWNIGDIQVNKTYVIVVYEGEYYPGIVTDIEGDEFEVSTMVKCGPTRWKWPKREDKIWYQKEELKEVISHPKEVCGASSRISVTYIVEEMNKYRKV